MLTKSAGHWILLIGLISINILTVSSTYDLCKGKSGIGGECDYNSDCSGAGVICKNGKCDCHYYFQVRNDSDGSKYCSQLPSSIGNGCSGSCRYPMFCSNGQCQCVRAKAEGKQCYPSSKLGDSCSQNAECTMPFSACSGGRCSCIPGTSGSKGQCVAAHRCPDGSKPAGNCVRFTSGKDEVENQLSNSGVDSCPENSYCYTSDVSPSGHCCPLSCPYNTAPDTSFSCAPGAKNPCPSDTHHCHRLAGQRHSMAACCRRPCKEPTPFYINGKCYTRAWLGSTCSASEQCLGGDTMQCSNGRCVCKSGYTPQSDSFTSSEHPPQSCVKSCSGEATSKNGECFAPANVGGTCDIDEQCPQNSKCLRGRCTCDCNNGYSQSGGSCVKASPTTHAPGQGVTNAGGGGFLGLVGGLLKGGGGGGGGNGPASTILGR